MLLGQGGQTGYYRLTAQNDLGHRDRLLGRTNFSNCCGALITRLSNTYIDWIKASL
jgi:hypothetical protein